MNEVYTIDREFLFKSSIYEITSISIEQDYDINASFVEGEFIVSGDYRLHEISINKEDFSFKIPFRHELSSNINLDSIEVDITDFNYDFKNEDELSVHIEYTVTGEENIIEIDNKEELEEFLDKHDAEVIDLSDEEERVEELPLIEESNDNSAVNLIEEEVKEERNNTQDTHNMILNSVNSEEVYVKYHVHTVTMEDTIESICNKYNTNLNTIKKYNTFDALELNMKLLIPENEES